MRTPARRRRRPNSSTRIGPYLYPEITPNQSRNKTQNSIALNLVPITASMFLRGERKEMDENKRWRAGVTKRCALQHPAAGHRQASSIAARAPQQPCLLDISGAWGLWSGDGPIPVPRQAGTRRTCLVLPVATNNQQPRACNGSPARKGSRRPAQAGSRLGPACLVL